MTNEELAEQDEQDLRAVLSTRQGARFVARLLEFCGVYRVSFSPQDALTTAFKEGSRNVGLMVYGAALAAEQNAASLLQQANRERETTEE